MSPRRGGALRRRAQARRLRHRHARPLRDVGAGLPRGRDRARDAPRGDPAPGRSRGAAPRRDEDGRRPHAPDDRLCPRPCPGARRARALRIRPQARLAVLRDGAREGLLRGRDARAHGAGSLRERPRGRAPAPAGRGGGPPDGPAPPRELHHARVRPPPPRGPPRGGRPGGRSGRVPHGAQVPAPRPQPAPLRDARAPGGRATRRRAGTMARRLRGAVHGRPRGDGDDQEARQRAPAPHGLLQGPAGRRPRSGSCSGSSTTTRGAWFPWSSRSPSSITTWPGSTSPTSATRSTSGRIPRSSCSATTCEPGHLPGAIGAALHAADRILESGVLVRRRDSGGSNR